MDVDYVWKYVIDDDVIDSFTEKNLGKRCSDIHFNILFKIIYIPN